MKHWAIIAKNELRIQTSRFRTKRRIFFLSLYTIFIFWGFYFGPYLFDIILPKLVSDYSVDYKPLIGTFIEYGLFLIFLIALLFPLTSLYKKEEIDTKETILASPIKPGDLFIGKFLGQLPLFFLIFLGIGPVGISLLMQVNTELNVFHFLILYIIFFTDFIFGYLIGTILANLLEIWMRKNRKAKELGNVLLFIIALIVIIIYFISHFVFGYIFNHPEAKNWLSTYPSFWYSNIALYLIDPLYLEFYIFNIWTNIILAVSIPLLIFYVSYKKAEVFYKLDFKFEKDSGTIEKEKQFYKFFRMVTPRKWEGLVIAQLKEFSRKKENVSQFIYSIALLIIMGVVFALSLEDLDITIKGINFNLSISNLNYLIVFLLSWMGGVLFGALMGSYIFIGSRDILYLYKRSPRGIHGLVWSYLYMMFYLVIMTDIILTIVFAFIFQLDFLMILMFFGIYLISCEIILFQIIGIQCINPLYTRSKQKIFINFYIIISLQVISLLITLFVVLPIIDYKTDISIGLVILLLINLGISAIFAILILYTGIKKLTEIE